MCKKVVAQKFTVHLYINNKNNYYKLNKAIMKPQGHSKITKKTVFIYKAVKVQDNFSTHPTGDISHSIATSFIVAN
ncbi:hypothetical protein GCM10011413_30300 [Pedobacter psychrotolerans]|uniref:Uncharacterized protein n=2 Tax=Pedobacter psychrotolerans TaxID=1843235 RepID=A0ABQ1SSE7_9SPHI|nr:hypothetical protein GCM10011413_30300 [Pedobacter psychrotolerans]